MKEEKQTYAPPLVEWIEAEVENGFAASVESEGTESYGDVEYGSWT